MTIFYSSSTNQEEIMPNLYTKDPARATYPDMQFPGNTMCFHHPSSAPYTLISQEPTAEASNLITNCIGENMQNVWKEERNEMLLMQTVGDESTNDDPHLGILNGQNFSLRQSNGSAMHGQALSLSLGTQVSVPAFHHFPATADISFSIPNQPASGRDYSCKDSLAVKNARIDSSHHSLSYLTSFTLSLTYLKAAQELLDEVVSVRKALKKNVDKSQNLGNSSGRSYCKDVDGGSKSSEVPSNCQEDSASSTKELSASEKQELQTKVAKLTEMLDEVDQRYKQYYHQMQIVMSSFDFLAGPGAAKPYTTLALQAISRHFRCLRDAISAQIEFTRKKLGEQDMNGGSIRLSRLRCIDQQLRQRRVMQQYGMIEPHAWRPQRGLPENSVSILRAWLFENFLHPYPKDSEKLMLARQTGLTRSQVANWFINARVRLWKPMIEEIYKEEIGGADTESKSSSENQPKFEDVMRYSVDREDPRGPQHENCKISHSNEPSKSNPKTIFDSCGSIDPLNPETREQRSNVDDCSLMHSNLNHPDNGSGRIMAYQMAKPGQYGTGMVSLTLGLQQSFMTVRGSDVYGSNPLSLEANTDDYDYSNMSDRLNRFGSLHFMQDFAP